jgi:hypothetical protein
VAFSRVRYCSEDIPDQFWPPKTGSKISPPPKRDAYNTDPGSGTWRGRLRQKTSLAVVEDTQD